MPQVGLLLKMPCDRTSWIGTEVGNPLRLPNHEQDPQRHNALMSRVLRAAHSCSMSRAIYSPAQRNRQPARPTPQTEAPIAPRQGDPGSRVTLACNMESSPQWRFLRFPVAQRTTAQDALWQNILDRNRSSQPFMTPCACQIMNRILGDLTPSWAGCWGPPSHVQWTEQYTHQHKETNNQQGRPPDRGPHRTQARQPRVPCDIGPQYGIISTVKIPAVSSGTTWTLSLGNFLWTCKTQVRSTFATS